MITLRHSGLLVLMLALFITGCAHDSTSSESPAGADGTSEPSAPTSGPVSSDGVVHDTTPCIPLADHLQQLAGDGAIDCGTIAPDADPSAAWSCVDAAQRAGNAFKVALLKRGKDSTVTTAWTRDAAGEITRISSDSDPTGSNQNKPAHGTKPCAQATLRPKDEGLQYGALFTCAATTEPERRCRSHGFEGQ
jgi:hypothetical protein